jgi:hypothetical protein
VNALERLGAASLAFVLTTASLAAQSTGGASIIFQGYSFDEELGTDAANLLLVPLAVRLATTDAFEIDFFGAWAEGRVERDENTFVLNGLVDSRIRVQWRVTPLVSLSISTSLPTGNSSHTAEEAIVASVLSSDILAFQESNWGTGFSITGGFATAWQFGDWGIGFGGSYRQFDEFEPQADQPFVYHPGNELRSRIAVDRNVGETGKLTFGGTYQTYETDLYQGRNLFNSGDRVRGDFTYSFRSGSSTWSLFVVDVYRNTGDLSLRIINDAGAVVGDSTVNTGSQNLLVAGVQGAIPIGSTVYFRPNIDFRMQSVAATDQGPEAGGWVTGFGGDIPLRVSGAFDFFPRARVSFGQLKTPEGINRSFWGFEGSATIRFR